MSFSPRIAIVGAGPGGLTLSLFLHRKSIPFTLFELRQQPTKEELEEPAGSLDLHAETGLNAIEELGLLAEFHSLTGDCTEEMIITDKDGKVLYQKKDDESSSVGRPEISRNKLTRLLLSQIPTSAIKWQHKLKSVTQAVQSDGTSKALLDFGNDGVEEFDLVIGADGAWSQVRKLLTDAKPVYSGQQNITINIRNIGQKYPKLSELVGSGSFMALAQQHGIVSQRAVQDTARIYCFIKTNDENFAETHSLRTKTPSEIKNFLFEGPDAPLRGFGPVIKALVTAACDDETATHPTKSVDIRSISTLFKDLTPSSWGHKSGATLIGDAAHLMPPNGEGVNTAMQDAYLLAKSIESAFAVAKGDGKIFFERMDKEILDFEDEMLARSKVIAQETAEILRMMYGVDNAAEVMADFFKSAG